jgi:phage terminase small subunit
MTTRRDYKGIKTPKMEKPISLKRSRFIKEYLIDLNGTQAAIRAGYSPKSAGIIADELLKIPYIKDGIQVAMDARSKRTDITQDNILKDLNEIKERCMQRSPVMEYDSDLKMLVQARDENGKHIWQFEANPAIKALELLGKHLRMWTDKTEVTGQDGGPININIILHRTNEY